MTPSKKRMNQIYTIFSDEELLVLRKVWFQFGLLSCRPVPGGAVVNQVITRGYKLEDMER